MLVGAMILWCQSAMPAPVESTPLRRMSLHVEDRKAARPGTWRVTQGESLRLDITADSPTTVHLHGYDIERRVMPGTPAALSFAATITGRFPIVTHVVSSDSASTHRERVLLYLEVHPR